VANDVKTSAQALVEAAKRLLPERAPSTVSGRELAAEAGVNYGLVHHYFGSKDAVFREAFLALRADFLARHGDADLPTMLVEPDDPYVLALARSQVGMDPEVRGIEDFPIMTAVVAAITERLGAQHPDWRDDVLAVEAKARAIATVGMQLAYSVFNSTLLDSAGVAPGERDDVESVLARLYGELSARR
jgi:AcrR family transcriptional regulator